MRVPNLERQRGRHFADAAAGNEYGRLARRRKGNTKETKFRPLGHFSISSTIQSRSVLLTNASGVAALFARLLLIRPSYASEPT